MKTEFKKNKENCPALLATFSGDCTCGINKQYCCYENCPMVFWLNIMEDKK